MQQLSSTGAACAAFVVLGLAHTPTSLAPGTLRLVDPATGRTSEHQMKAGASVSARY